MAYLEVQNSIVFEKRRMSYAVLIEKALEESELWHLQSWKDTPSSGHGFGQISQPSEWSPHVLHALKCNVGFSWVNTDSNSGSCFKNGITPGL